MGEQGHASDGKGIDHTFDAYGDDLIGILCDATVAPEHPFCSGGPPQ